MRHTGEGIEERLSELERLVDKIDRSVEKIELVTIIREPNVSIAADAYNGLRKQVIAAANERSAHLVQLAHFSRAVDDAVPYESLRQLVDEWMQQASLIMFNDPAMPEYFEVTGIDGDELEIVTPAYVDAVTRRTIKMGRAQSTSSAGRQVSPVARPDRGDPQAGRTEESRP